jgi:hypothetical protein
MCLPYMTEEQVRRSAREITAMSERTPLGLRILIESWWVCDTCKSASENLIDFKHEPGCAVLEKSAQVFYTSARCMI